MENCFNETKVAALLLTQGKQPLLVEKCLYSLLSQKNVSFDIFIVNNGSDEKFWNEQLYKFNNLNLITFDVNLGFTGGFNEAIKIIEFNTKNTYSFYWLLNDDLELDSNCLANMMKLMVEMSDVGFAGPETFRIKNPKIHDQWITYLPNKHNPGQIELNNEMNVSNLSCVDVQFVVGHCMLVRSKAIIEIGLMRNFFIYWDEIEWQWRAKKSGWRSIAVPGSIAFHERDSFGSSKNLFYRTRNYIYFNRIILFDNLSFFPYFIKNLILETLDVIRQLQKNKFKSEYIICFIKGLFHGFFHKVPCFEKINTKPLKLVKTTFISI